MFVTPEKTPKEIAVEVEQTRGWNLASFYKKADNKLYVALTSGKLIVDIGKLSAKGDVVSVPFKFTNNSDKVVSVMFEAITSTEDKRTPRYQQRITDVIVFPGKTVDRSINVIIPAKSTNEERTIFAEVFVQDSDTESIKMNRSFIAPEKF